MSTDLSIPPPASQQIGDTNTTNGSQSVTGVVYGNVAFGNTAASNAPQPRLSPKPASTVPFRRDPDFVERGDTLDRVHERCSQPTGRVALVGLGGVGKSQLAIEYAHRVRDQSPGTWVFWVFASNAAGFGAAYEKIADRIGLPGSKSTAETIRLVNNWLSDEDNGPWLIILDNVDDASTLHAAVGRSDEEMSIIEVVPQSGNGAVLITSRNIDVARELVGREQDILRVGQMHEEEAVALLQKKLSAPPPDDHSSRDLLAALEFFPLAITQAAAYINRQPGMDPTEYLARLNATESKTLLLERKLPDTRRSQKAENSILKTWQISFGQIESEQPGAADLLSFMSFFHWQGIPTFMLRYYTSDIENDQGASESLQHGGGDAQFEEHIAILHSFSLISTANKPDEFHTHELVQFATRAWLTSTGKEERWRTSFVTAMAAEFPSGEFESWPVCRILLPHVQSLVTWDPSTKQQSTVRMQILRKAGNYSRQSGRLSQAERIIEASIRESGYNIVMDKREMLPNRYIFSMVLLDRGKYHRAENVAREILAEFEAILEADGSYTLASLGNLALVLRKLGDYGNAAAMYQRVLATVKEEPTDDNIKLRIASMNNLAVVYSDQGKIVECETINRQAVALHKEVFGDDHPKTLMCANNLAMALQARGDHEGAVHILQWALAGYKKVLEPDHLDTLICMGNLAAILHNRGEYEEAEAMTRQVLAVEEEKLGHGHLTRINTMNNLSVILRFQEKYEESEFMVRRALACAEASLDKDHAVTLDSTYGLAFLLALREQHKEARALLERAYAGYERRLGSSHPTTAACYRNLSFIVSEMNQA